MAMVEIQVDGDVRQQIKDIQKLSHGAHLNAIRKALIAAEKFHKRGWWLSGGSRFKASGQSLKTVDTHPTRLTTRSGSGGLKASYTRVLIERELYGSYGSDKEYARIHEYGGETGRKGARFIMPIRDGINVTQKKAAKGIERIFAKELKKAGL